MYMITHIRESVDSLYKDAADGYIGGETGGAMGAVAPTKYKVWGHRPHDPTITYGHDSDKASPLY